jgi:hypothetical protein
MNCSQTNSRLGKACLSLELWMAAEPAVHFLKTSQTNPLGKVLLKPHSFIKGRKAAGGSRGDPAAFLILR